MTPPTISDFKTFFSRDFPYGTTATTVNDSDITRALGDAALVFNACLFTSDASYSSAYLYLAAHYLVENISLSNSGTAGGGYSWLVSSRSVGSVSESFTIPEWVSKNPILAMLLKTKYGARYVQYLLPLMIGNVFTVSGATQP